MLSHYTNTNWNLFKPYLISLTGKGHFFFRFSSSKERDFYLSQYPLTLQNKKFNLLPWSPSQGPFEWPSLHTIWIRIQGIPYHCWSSNILLSIASSVGYPLNLNEIIASQKIITFARILVNLDISKPKPQHIWVDSEGESEVLLSITYENLPCPKCFSFGH